MFKKSRIKIVGLIMGVMILFLAVTFSVIYFTSYKKVNEQNREMLQLYADQYAQNGLPSDSFPQNNPHDFHDTNFQLSTFYSVSFSTDGEALEINNDRNPHFSDEELIAFCQELLTASKSYGTKNHMVYLITEESNFTLVTIMDNTVLGENIQMLLHYTILFCSITLMLLLVLSIFFSNWIIRPLEKNHQKQKQFISDAGHELKTPISTISANAELLGREVKNNLWLENIIYENKRMEAIVYQLLDLARAENTNYPKEQINLSEIVLAGVLPFEVTAFEMKCQMTYSIEENLHFLANPQQMEQLISILTDNALCHVSSGGKIEILLKNNRNSIILKISNTGAEIPPEQRELIFDRFYRSDTARTSGNNHYGLGLSIAKAIAESHRGKISISCEDGVTTFSVVFSGK